MSHIQELREAIRKLHGVEARHVQSVPITEIFSGQKIWEGVVEVFDLVGHSSPRAYAWAFDDDDENRQHVVILHSSPITSPLKAVQAAIVWEIKNASAEES